MKWNDDACLQQTGYLSRGWPYRKVAFAKKRHSLPPGKIFLRRIHPGEVYIHKRYHYLYWYYPANCFLHRQCLREQPNHYIILPLTSPASKQIHSLWEVKVPVICSLIANDQNSNRSILDSCKAHKPSTLTTNFKKTEKIKVHFFKIIFT